MKKIHELKEKILFRVIARWLVNTGYRMTMEGNYHISFEETAEHFCLPIQYIVENKEKIAAYIDSNKKILSPTWLNEDFDMNFCMPETYNF